MKGEDPIVITGAGGQLGRALLRALGGLPLLPWTHAEADVAESEISDRLKRVRPRAILHAADLPHSPRPPQGGEGEGEGALATGDLRTLTRALSHHGRGEKRRRAPS